MEQTNSKITVNGVDYIPSTHAPTGNRAVVVVDRGWIFAGDITEEGDKIILKRAVWLFRWESIGFAEAVANPESDNVDIRPMSAPVEVPKSAEIFRVPVPEDWGM